MPMSVSSCVRPEVAAAAYTVPMTSRPRSTFAPLRHRPFAALWAGGLVSNVGTWMETVAAGVLVTQATGRAGWTGLIAIAAFVPTVALGPLGGALADRLPRRPLLLATVSAQMACAGLLAALALTSRAAPPVVALVLFAAGCAGALGFPAFQSLLPDLVPAEDLLGAIALSSAQWNIGRVLGPLLATIALAAGGPGWAFAANTLSFGAVLAALLTIHLPVRRASPPAPLGSALVAGARHAHGTPALRAALGCLALCSVLAGPFIALVPAMALTVLRAGPGGAATLVTAQGLGAVGAAVAVGPLAARVGRGRVLLTTIVALPPALALYAWAPGLLAAAVAIASLGGLYLSLLSGLSAVVQAHAPAALRGRVMALQGVVLSLFYAVGAVLQGALADRVGLRFATSGAAVALALALGGARLAYPHLVSALRGDVVARFESSDGPVAAR